MASLMLSSSGLEIAAGTAAAGGKAEFTIDPTGVPGKVEIWERTIKFPLAGAAFPPPPAFAFGGVFASTTPVSKNVPLANLYEVRLYREGEGNADGDGNVLDSLNFPCVLSDGGRSNFLTKCTEVPQVDIAAGGTFVSIAFAASKLTMARVQLARKAPDTGMGGLPRFPDRSVVATALSESTGPKFLHKMALNDGRMLPGKKLFFVIFVWDIAGSWDFVWDPDNAAVVPGTAGTTIETKQRSLDIRLIRLFYDDDSDALSNGEGDYTLVVQHKAPPAPPTTKKLSVPTFATGTSLTISPPTKLTFGPEVVELDTQNVSVQVLGHDDDTGSFPSDDDDFAATPMTLLDLPLGEGKEEVIDRLLNLKGNPSGGDDTLRFRAEVLYSVNYQ